MILPEPGRNVIGEFVTDGSPESILMACRNRSTKAEPETEALRDE
jgi:hypothetical protein